MVLVMRITMTQMPLFGTLRSEHSLSTYGQKAPYNQAFKASFGAMLAQGQSEALRGCSECQIGCSHGTPQITPFGPLAHWPKALWETL